MNPELAPRQATYADIKALPGHITGQIVDGELYAHPRPAMPHAIAATRLSTNLDGQFGGGGGAPGGWLIVFEPELHLGNDILVPDLAGWRRERMPHDPVAAHMTQAPDWICEVLSDATRRLDRILKLRKYQENGVGHLWFLDPAAQTLEALRLEGGSYLLAGSHAGEEKVRAEPFVAMELDLARLWVK